MKAIFVRNALLRMIKLIGAFFVCLAILIFALGIWFRVNNVYINTTPSLAVGLYKKVDAPIERGAYVAFCPPQSEVFKIAQQRKFIEVSNGLNGNCPSGHGLMLKQVMAINGDWVSIDATGVMVNGKKLALSEPLPKDDQNLPLPRFQLNPTLLGPSDVLLMANHHPRSFDARYFGLIDQKHIVARVKPLIIFFHQ